MFLNNIGAAFSYIQQPRPDPKHETRIISPRFHCRRDSPPSPAKVHWEKENVKAQSICTADELHRVTVPNSDWKLALWRYLPSPKVHKALNFTFFLDTLFTVQWCIFWVFFNFVVYIENQRKTEKLDQWSVKTFFTLVSKNSV